MRQQKQNRKQAKLFLSALRDNCGELVTPSTTWEFRTIDDGKKARGYEDKSLTRTLRGTLDQHWDTLVNLNNKGAGVFVQINENDGRGIKAANITKVRQYWVDCDHGLPDSFLLSPSIVVESSPGKRHYYWNLDKALEANPEFTQIQKQLIQQYKSDNSIHNLDRIMRLPGFFHCKGEPIMTTLVEANSCVYSQAELTEALPKVTTKAYKKRNTQVIGNIYETLAPVISLIEELKKRPEAYTLKPSKVNCDKRWSTGQKLVAGMERGVNMNTNLLKLGVCLAPIAYVYSVRDLLANVHRSMRAKFGAKGYNKQETTKTFLRGVTYGLYGLPAIDNDSDYRELTHGVVDAGDSWFPSIVNETAPIMALKGGTGTGKTTAIVNKVNAAERALIISHRRALAWKAAVDCEGMISYDNKEATKAVKSLSSISKLVITFDSLPLLVSNLKPYDIIVLDEVDQSLLHLLTSDTLKKSRREAVEVFAALISQPKTQLVLASATLGNLDLEAIMGLRKSNFSEIKALVNKKKPEARNYVVCETVEAVVAQLLEHAKKGDKCYLASDSKRKVDRVARNLQKLIPDLSLLTITSDNASEDLGDINKVVQQYQVVLASPSLATGVDINCSHFDVVFGIFTNYQDITYADCLQAIARVRYPKQKLAYVHISKETGGKQLTEADIRDIHKLAEAEPEFTTLDPSTLERNPVNENIYNWVLNTTVKLLHRKHEEKRFRARKFWQAIRDAGHNVTKLANLSNEARAEIKAQLAEAAEEIKAEEIQTIAAAEMLRQDEVDRLKEKQKLSKAEKSAVDKFFISNAVGREATDGDVEAYNFGTLQKTTQLYKLLCEGLAKAERATAETLDNLPQDKKHTATEYKLLTTALELLWAGVKDNQFTKETLEASGFVSYLRERSSELRKHLGLKVDISKPSVTANQLLRLLGYTVKTKDKRKRTTNTSKSLSLYSKEQGLTGVNSEARTYTISQTPEQVELVQRLTARYTPEPEVNFQDKLGRDIF